MILDEFGKNLEATDNGADSDPYLLQQLAEAGQGSGLPIFLLTLQHLSFEDHLDGADSPRRREWAKVQGRFEDVTYADSPAGTRALIGSAFEVGDEALKGRIARWARREATEMGRLGVVEMSDAATVEVCYPLHPLTALVLPELCARYGQHERTLFSFLTDPDPAGASSFLKASALPTRGALPTVGLDSVYAYFVAAGGAGAVGRSSRWVEIATRLRDIHGLTARQERMARSVAVLNLVSATGVVRASEAILSRIDPQASRILAELQDADLVTYRRSSDEYRLWQGSDVDLGQLLDSAAERIAARSAVDVLADVDPPAPQVAARHSAEHGTLRVFSRRYADGVEAPEAPSPSSPYDGEMLIVLAEPPPSPAFDAAGCGDAAASGAKPVVATVPDKVAPLVSAAREVATLAEALGDPAVADDWVAKRELGERLAQARTLLEHARSAALGSDGCRWMLLNGAHGVQELPAGRGSAPLSTAADLAYPATPPVRNEMLNRSQLTSQGAKARRELLEAMIERGDEADLGLAGFGPEVAMYRAFLARSGMHSPDGQGHWGFRAPTDPQLQPAWDAAAAQLDRAKRRRVNLGEVFSTLRSPPVGMKDGAVAVFVTAGLLARSDDVALYEHGTFKPLLTSELSERMVRNPAHFDLKCFANTTGARRAVVGSLVKQLGLRALPGERGTRVANVVAPVRALVSRVRRLDKLTLRTSTLPADVLAVRDALLSATEPDALLFEALPTALGFPEAPVYNRTYKRSAEFASALVSAVECLEGHLADVLDDLCAALLAEAGERSRQAISGLAAALDGEVLDGDVRAFVGALANASADDDRAWMATVATVVARKAPAEWVDDDLRRFRAELPRRMAAFGRLVALHTEHRSDGGGPFEALRMTLTRSDGVEYVRLVGVDERRRRELEDALDSALSSLAPLTGSTQAAGHAMLALLGERLVASETSAAARVEDSVANLQRRSDDGHAGVAARPDRSAVAAGAAT